MTETQTASVEATIGAIIDKASHDEALALYEQWQIGEREGWSEDERRETLADIGSYGITEDMLLGEVEQPDDGLDPEPDEDELGETELDGDDPDDQVEEQPVQVIEEPGGQHALDIPSNLSTEVFAARPKKATVKIGATKVEVDHDLQPGDRKVYVSHVMIAHIDGLGGDERTHVSEVLEVVEFDTSGVEMKPADVVQSLLHLETRDHRDRAVIDQCCEMVQLVWENATPESVIDGVADVRERMYARYKIEDDAQEVTRGTPDHVEPDEGWDDPEAS